MRTLLLFALACGAPSADREPLGSATSSATVASTDTTPAGTSGSSTSSGTTPSTPTTGSTTTASTDTGLAIDTGSTGGTVTVTDTAPLELYGTYPPYPLPPAEFAARNRDGTPRSQVDLIGHPTVMWFFPLAGTPG